MTLCSDAFWVKRRTGLRVDDFEPERKTAEGLTLSGEASYSSREA
jgi:hypothetical protein